MHLSSRALITRCANARRTVERRDDLRPRMMDRVRSLYQRGRRAFGAKQAYFRSRPREIFNELSTFEARQKFQLTRDYMLRALSLDISIFVRVCRGFSRSAPSPSRRTTCHGNSLRCITRAERARPRACAFFDAPARNCFSTRASWFSDRERGGSAERSVLLNVGIFRRPYRASFILL